MKEFEGNVRPYLGAAAFFLAFSVPQGASAGSITIGGTEYATFTGYVRQHFSVNLEDHPELGADGRPIGGAGELSMARTTLQLQLNSDLRFAKLTLVGRMDREFMTDYMEDLDDAAFQLGSLQHEYKKTSLREAYLDIPLGERVSARLGRQQVVWGETDLFQALDIVHGRDFTWRSILEPEDEEWRKPLIMANVNINVPEAGGSLQLLYRPGWDNDQNMGNTLDFFGGRWAAQPNKGVNTLALIPFNYYHTEGDVDDPSYGFRWTGTAGEAEIGYSLAYYHTLNDTPILNVSAPFLGITPYQGHIGAGAGDLGVGSGAPPGLIMGEFILPEIDVIGGSANAYSRKLDTVFRTEIAFTPDKPFNAGGHPTGLPLVREKDAVRIMIGLDKQLRLMNLLGTDSASFMTIQYFNTWIPDFDEADGLIDIPPSHLKEHSGMLIATLGLSYRSNTIQPSLVLGLDTTYGGGVVLPAVNMLFGEHWRVRLDAPLFFKSGSGCSTQPGGAGGECTHLFGTFDNNDQFAARFTYQF